MFNLILVAAISGRPKPEICFLPGRFKWTLSYDVIHKKRKTKN